MKPIDPVRVMQLLRARHIGIGSHFELQQQTGSTNDDAIRGAGQGASDGSVFVADSQTSGRGRMQRKWQSPPGQNLYVSVLLRPNLELLRLPPLALAAGLGVADTVAAYVSGKRTLLKWPNDVLVDGRKIAGVLVESSAINDRCEHVVIGIGLNVLQTAFDDDIADTATSLMNAGCSNIDRTLVLVDLLTNVTRRVRAYAAEGLDPMMGELSSMDATVGRTVQFGLRRGTSEGIAPDGRLRVRCDEQVVLLHAGEIKIL